MTVKKQITDYIAAQPERKRSDMQALHRIMLRLMPGCRLWFLDGKDERGRTVSNPNIGYGKALGKASVTGYCIKFTTLSDIDVAALEAAVR